MSKPPTLTELQRKLLADPEEFGKGDGSTHKLVDYHREEFDCFECEFVIRPSDNALVVHLKRLPPLLRKTAFFKWACNRWREKIGAFKRFEAYYTDKVDDANAIYSLDMIFTDYYPAIMGDIKYMERHIFKIASDLNYDLASELQEFAARKDRRVARW